jgi:hypothetical protein
LWSQDDGGLIEFEKTYVESVMENKNTVSVTYQIIDENQRLVGYEKDFSVIKQQLLDTFTDELPTLMGILWQVTRLFTAVR